MSAVTLRLGRRDVRVSRADKRLFPSGITKEDLARYYEAVAPVMVPHVAKRPLILERYPDGTEGHRIIQQHASGHFPPWVGRVEVPARNGTVEHVVANDAATLVYLADQACITPHAWLSRSDKLDRPDRFVIDLDPSNGKPADVRRAAIQIGELLREVGLDPWAMTTGSRGYHIVVPLRRRAEFDEVRELARRLAELAAAREPRVFTTEQRKAKREGRILIDVMRNAYAHSAVAPYAVRPRPNAPVATPLHWDELSESRTKADRWTLRSVIDRIRSDGDPWRDIARHAVGLGPARRKLDQALVELTRVP